MKKVFFAVLLAVSLSSYAYADTTDLHQDHKARVHNREASRRGSNAHHRHPRHRHHEIKKDHQ